MVASIGATSNERATDFMGHPALTMALELALNTLSKKDFSFLQVFCFLLTL